MLFFSVIINFCHFQGVDIPALPHVTIKTPRVNHMKQLPGSVVGVFPVVRAGDTVVGSTYSESRFNNNVIYATYGSSKQS